MNTDAAVKNSVLDSITILNAPLNSFSLNYNENLLVKNIIVNNTAAGALLDGETVGHNTDGQYLLFPEFPALPVVNCASCGGLLHP